MLDTQCICSSNKMICNGKGSCVRSELIIEQRLVDAEMRDENIKKVRNTPPLQSIPKALDDSSIKQFKGFKLKKIFQDPNQIINIGVIKSEMEWQEVFHDEDLNCSIKKDWFEEDYEYVFKSQEELDMYISAYFELNFDNIKNTGYEIGKKHALEVILQYPHHKGVNDFKNEIKQALKNKFGNKVSREKLKRVHILINNVYSTINPSKESLMASFDEIIDIIKEIPDTESLD